MCLYVLCQGESLYWKVIWCCRRERPGELKTKVGEKEIARI